MLREDERFIFLLQTVVEMEPAQAPKVPMNVIMDRLLLRFKKGESIKLIENEKASLRIHDMEIDDKAKIAHLLIHYYDTRVSDPVFGQLKSGTLRKESKLKGEGIAVSAHLIISMVPTTPRGNVYNTLLEEAPGIGRSRLTPFLRSEIKAVSDDKYKESGVEKKCKPSILMSGIMSKGLKGDLEKGQLRGVTLVKHTVKDIMDEPSVMIPVKESIDFRVPKGLKGKFNPIETVKNAFKDAKKNEFDDVVVHYTHSSKRSRSVSVNTKIKDAMDVVFTRLEPIKLDNPMAQCEPKINDELKNKMIPLLIKPKTDKKKEVNKQEETIEAE